MTKGSFLFLITALYSTALHAAQPGPATVERWGLHEIGLRAERSYSNPFRQVALSAEFRHRESGLTLSVPGFYDGDGKGGQTGRVWKVRFMPPKPGTWTWKTSVTPPDAGLDGRTGSIEVGPPGPGNRGPICRAGPPYLHLPHADGHHTFLIGTWSIPMHFNPAERERFYDYFQSNGMTRIRMWMGGRKADGTEDRRARFYRGDFWRYNLALFHQVDTTFRECQARGILVDLIPFVNDMEKDMTPQQQEQYLRFLAARYGAFRSLMVCLCNQTDWHFGGAGGEDSIRRSVEWANWAGGYLRRVNPFPTPLSTHDPGEEGPWSKRTYYLGALSRWPYAAWTDHVQKQIQATALSAAKTMSGMEPRADVLNERGLARINLLIQSLRNEFRQAVEVNEPSFEFGDGIEKKLSWRSLTRTGVRKTHWVITASGSFGTTCVVGCGEFMSGWDVDKLQQRGTLAQLGILARTMRSLPFWEMPPANDLVSPLDTVLDGEHWRSTFAIAKPGQAYLVYSLNGGRGSIQLAPGTYKVTQLNPRDGSMRALGEVGGGTVPFTLPSRTPKDHNLEDETDWVLLYRR
jgi:hypothetical protein